MESNDTSSAEPFRHSFNRDKFTQAAEGLALNRFGHTVTQSEVMDENTVKAELSFDAFGERRAYVDIFDTPVMQMYMNANGVSLISDEAEETPQSTEVAAITEDTVPVPSDMNIAPAPNTIEEFEAEADRLRPRNGFRPASPTSTPPVNAAARLAMMRPEVRKETIPVPVVVSAAPKVVVSPATVSGVASSKQRTCTNTDCHLTLPENANFCPDCGTPQWGKHCIGCGLKFVGREKFCPECGVER